MADIFAEQLNSWLNEFKNVQDTYNKKSERLKKESNKANGECSEELDELNDQLRTDYKKLENISKQIQKSVLDELDKRLVESKDPDLISEINRSKNEVEKVFRESNDIKKWFNVLNKIGII